MEPIEVRALAALRDEQLRVMPDVRPPAGTNELLAFLHTVPGLASENVLRMGNYSVAECSGRLTVFNGDQPLFYADTPGEAYSFVAGLAVMANEFVQRADPAIFVRDDSPDIPR